LIEAFLKVKQPEEVQSSVTTLPEKHFASIPEESDPLTVSIASQAESSSKPS